MTAELPGVGPADLPALLSTLPQEHAPYVVIAHDLVRGSVRFEPKATLVEASDVASWVARGVHQFFIASTALSPWVTTGSSDCELRRLSVNGLVNVQLGRPGRDGDTDPSTAGVVSQVINHHGERVRHEQYIRVYRALVAAARRRTRTS